MSSMGVETYSSLRNSAGATVGCSSILAEVMEDDSSVCSSESVTLLKHVSLLSGELLLRNNSVFAVNHVSVEKAQEQGSHPGTDMELPLHKSSLLLLEDNGVEFNIHLITLGLTLSIAGWIADVRFGRYGMVYWSMWIMWAALILATVSSVLARTVDSYTCNIHSYVNGVMWTIMALGFGGFQG